MVIQAVSLPTMTADVDPAENDLDMDVFLLREIDRSSQQRRLTAFSSSVDRQVLIEQTVTELLIALSMHHMQSDVPFFPE